jgi:hypothetical protein
MSDTDRIERLERLARLRDQGMLSPEEFEREKAALLAAPAAGGGSGRTTAIAIACGCLLLLVVAAAAWWSFRDLPVAGRNATADAGPSANATAPAAAPAPAAPAPAATAAPVREPLLGNCHMDTCSYSREVGRETVREAPSGRLLRVSLLGGTQGDAGDDGPSDDAPIIWDRQPHDIFVFCSTALPAVMLPIAGQRLLQTDLLDFLGPDGIPDVLTTSANLYFDICHGIRGREWADVAPGLGYHPLAPALVESGIDIARPEDIFAHAR